MKPNPECGDGLAVHLGKIQTTQQGTTWTTTGETRGKEAKEWRSGGGPRWLSSPRRGPPGRKPSPAPGGERGGGPKQKKKKKKELELQSDATIELGCGVSSVLGSVYVRGTVEANTLSLKTTSLSPLLVVLWCDSAMQ